MPDAVNHLAYVNNNELAFTGVPWWGTGKSAREASFQSWLTDEQAADEIGWQVEKRPLYRQTASGLFVQTGDSFENVRVDTDEYIATVGSVHKTFQGSDIIDFGSTLVDDFGAKWDTVGSLHGNRIVFASLRLDVVTEEGRGLSGLADIDADKDYLWLLLHDTRDGSAKFRSDVVRVRPVCANTVSAAQQSAATSWSIRHCGTLDQRVAEARASLGLITQFDADYNAWAIKLAEADFEQSEFEQLAEHLLPTKTENGQDAGKVVAKRNADRQGALLSSWLHSDTIDDSWRFTKYGAFQGVTEWAEHKADWREDKRTPQRERRLLSTCFGGTIQKLRDRTAAYLT